MQEVRGVSSELLETLALLWQDSVTCGENRTAKRRQKKVERDWSDATAVLVGRTLAIATSLNGTAVGRLSATTIQGQSCSILLPGHPIGDGLDSEVTIQINADAWTFHTLK